MIAGNDGFVFGPTGGNVRYDAIASISCVDKALQTYTSIYAFKKALQKFPTSLSTSIIFLF